MVLTERFTTRTYSIKDDIFIDIICDDVRKTYEAFMYDVNYGVKFFMVGMKHEITSFYDFVFFVESETDLYLAILENQIKKAEEEKQ